MSRFNFNASDPSSGGNGTCVAYIVADGTNNGLYDYINGPNGIYPIPIPTSVSGSSLNGNPTIEAPRSQDATWPWPNIVQPIGDINTFPSSVQMQAMAMGSIVSQTFSGPIGTWASTGPGTSAGAGYTYAIAFQLLGTAAAGFGYVGDTNSSASNTFYTSIATGKWTTTFKNSSGTPLVANFTYPTASWMFFVCTILLGTGGVMYANTNAAGSLQTPVASGLTVIQSYATANPNKSWGLSFVSQGLTSGLNNTPAIHDNFQGRLAFFGIWDFPMTAAQVNALALNPFSALSPISGRRSLYGRVGARGLSRNLVRL